MGAKLLIVKGKTSIKEIPLGSVKTTIGRRTDCAVRIPSALVSRRHCELVYAGGRLLVKDLGSSNGTFVNGSKVREKELHSGDTLGVGPLTFIVQLEGAPVSPSDTARPPALAAAAEPAVDDAADFVVDEASAAADFVLPDEEPTVDASELELAETDDVSDFVVEAEAASADAIADFVVADELPADDAAAQALAAAEELPAEQADDFVVAEQGEDDIASFAAEDDASFVVADEVSGDAETVRDHLPDRPEETGDASDEAAAEPAQAKKRGFLGRIFGKKQPEPSPAAVPSARQPVKPRGATQVKPQPAPPRPPKQDATAPLHAAEEPAAASDSPDDLADFLMSPNEKDK